MYEILLVIIIGYSFGCIQSAYFVGKKVGGIDIRNHGTENAGASNVVTVLGWRYGVYVALFDIAKGFFAVQFINMMYPDNLKLKILVGSMVVLGHIFPVFLGFKGGKGAASFIGVTLGINPLFGLLNIITIIGITIVTDYIALGTIVMYTMMLVVGLFAKLTLDIMLLEFLLLVVVLYKHKENIDRILSGTEIGLRENLNKIK